MSKLNLKNGVTSVILRVKIMDSTSTTGGAKTGLTSASSGLIISTIADNEATATAYTVAASNVETITTLGTFAAPTASKCRFKEVDATNHPGLYEIQIANARWAVASSRSVIVSVHGATGACQVDAEIQLEPVPANVTQLLDTAWLTPGTAGTPDVNVKLWNALTTVALPLVPTTAGRTLDVSAGGEAGIDWANVGSPTTLVTFSNTVIGTVTTTTTATTATNVTTVNGLAANVITAASIASNAITAAKVATDAIGAAQLAADAVTEIQSGLATGTALSDVHTDLTALTINTAAVKADTAAILLDTGTDGVVVASGSKTGYSLAAAGLDSIVIETGMNARQAVAIITASTAGVLSGAATTSIVVKGGGVATTRIAATVDASGNRSAVTLTLPA